MENQNNIGATTNTTNVELKEFTRKNLIRVLEELPELVKKMPEIKEKFFMNRLGVYDDLGKENLSECCSVGCLLGNASRIFEKEFTDELFIKNKFHYHNFSNKFFPYLFNSSCGDPKWLYLFDARWVNTKFGDLDSSLQRIENLLANDLECWDYSYKTNKIIN